MKKTMILTAVISAIFAGSACAKTPVKTPEKVVSQTTNINQNKEELTIFKCDLENNNVITVNFNKNNKLYKFTIEDKNNKIKTFLINGDEVEPPHYFHNGDTGAVGITIISYNKNFDAFISGEVENRDISVNISKLNFSSKCKQNKIAYDFLQLDDD